MIKIDEDSCGVTFTADNEIISDWVKPGQWIAWRGMFSAPYNADTDGHWLGKIVMVQPRPFKHSPIRLLVHHLGETEYTDIHARMAYRMEEPDAAAIFKYVQAYFTWLNRP